MTMQLNTTVEIKAVIKDKGLPVAVRMEHWGKAFYVPLDHALIKQAGLAECNMPDQGVEEITPTIDLEKIKRIDEKPCISCKHSTLGAMSCFGPDVYMCGIKNAPVAANHSCSQWTPRTTKDPE